MARELLQIRGLKKYFPVGSGLLSGMIRKRPVVHAVDGVSFDIRESETFGLVGESGCGKSTTGKLILRLIDPSGGNILFDGRDISELSGPALQRMRRRIQIVFQNPYASLDPRWTVERILGEPLETHDIVPRGEMKEKIADLLEAVGLDADHMYRYPHQFSGGQRQRIGLARALAVNPDLLVADEPVSALDVSIQAQVLNLIQDLRENFHLSILFISHDLSVVKYISDRVGVMYLGKLIEVAPVNELFDRPIHPYTQALLSAIPVAEVGEKKARIVLKGDVPSAINPPANCRFRTRCPAVSRICAEVEPKPVDVGNDHMVACHLAS
ncbi:MAG: ABC transporter ATP-binding protein [Deltaproteobacteria bacterium]|nr:ABC transporter ATP-binding protein [Deltaproteobacteria bacterium]MBW2122596.1 ABC transporter ATP-binding protein [Deltaproteobacteria bacterium]